MYRVARSALGGRGGRGTHGFRVQGGLRRLRAVTSRDDRDGRNRYRDDSKTFARFHESHILTLLLCFGSGIREWSSDKKVPASEPAPQLNNSTAREHRHPFQRQPLDKGLITPRTSFGARTPQRRQDHAPAHVDLENHWTLVQWRPKKGQENVAVDC